MFASIQYATVPLLILSVCLTTNARAQEKEPNQLRSFFIFLTTGRTTAGVEKEEVQKMQKLHIDNFVAQGKKGLLFAAGPVADPQKTLRGIVGVRAQDRERVPELFRDDPYVDQGFMKLEINGIDRELGKFEMILDPVGMEEHRLALFTKKESVEAPSQSERNQQWEYWQQVAREGKASAAFQFDDRSPRLSVAILKNTGEASVQELVQKDPLLGGGKVDSQIIPLYVSKGVLNYRAESN
ncbi:YciI-like protein [Pirellula sp. SH-Sr6A]|uniref:hypothetical protein n=1 Tax=Pirellula sp. SH-Sr6A TaxID=1632865 RepID=UPI00078CAF84|nr:hypothetical protein [Pirellula sp. SH-Sr6A]AMV33816.1 YciI-like protein [Pirellula sp. SH-Sr6A]